MKSTSQPRSAGSTAAPTVVFDVRLLPSQEKYARILQRWLDLPVDGFFVLLNGHDSARLCRQFEAQFHGTFEWRRLEGGPEEFRVRVTKTAEVTTPAARPSGEIDVRGLDPPEPLMRILAAMERLGAGQTLQARTDRQPCHLLGEAEQRGFRHECRAQADGSWITTLTRR